VPTLAVAVVGPDRPGVIAALTEVLLADGGNLTDSSMTILHGQFAMTLLVDVSASADQVRADLAPVSERLNVLIDVHDLGGAPAARAGRAQRLLVRVHGPDQPGLVHRITAAIAAAEGNITDLTTRLADGLYVLMAEVALPAGTSTTALEAGLRAVAADLGVTATVQPVDTDLL
jgi:glycine cleavage system transcriptional repressor